MERVRFLTVKQSIAYAKDKWDIELDKDAVRTAIRRKKLEAEKHPVFKQYTIKPGQLKEWLKERKRI